MDEPKRQRRKYIEVEVDIRYHTESVPIDYIMEQLTVEDLREELAKRKETPPLEAPTQLDAVERALLNHRPQEALILLQRIIGYRDFVIDPQVYEKAKATRDPETGRPLI